MVFRNIFIFCIVLAVVSSKTKFVTKVEDAADKVTPPPQPTRVGRGAAGEQVIENFVQTLLASERYLKMIESVDRKVTRMAALLRDKTDAVAERLTDVVRTVKSASAQAIASALRVMSTELRGKSSPPPRPGARSAVSGTERAELLGEPRQDSRLEGLEAQLRSLQAGVDTIVAVMTEVKSRQTTRTSSSVPLSRAEGAALADPTALLTEIKRAVRDKKPKKCECKNGRVDRSERYPTDCHEIQVQGFNVSGIYKIRPEDMDPFYVLCDLNTAGGGWTVIQNRFDGSQDFYKSWTDYEHGFGNLAGEFWLGLEKLTFLTNQKLYELRIELETHSGHDAFAAYSVFTVGPEHEGYRISTLGNFYGTAGDSLSYHAGQKFSTHDVDNDEWRDGACAREHAGAWWYKECDKSNLNGKYVQPGEDTRGQSIYWISFKGPNVPLGKTKMMIRPLPASKPADYGDASRRSREDRRLRLHPSKLTSRDKARAQLGPRGGGVQYAYQPPGSDDDRDGYFHEYA